MARILFRTLPVETNRCHPDREKSLPVSRRDVIGVEPDPEVETIHGYSDGYPRIPRLEWKGKDHLSLKHSHICSTFFPPSNLIRVRGLPT